MAYSQSNEEAVIIELLSPEKQVGHFLDVGAYDGKTFSNTMRLAELGWSGVCVEPSPSVFPGLLKNHDGNPRITCVNAAVAVRGGWLEFYDSNGDALSTSCQAHRERWLAAQVPFKKLLVYAVTWDMLLERFGTAFEFVNVDVEGVSFELFSAMPLQKLSHTRALCVEHDGHVAEIHDHAQRFGFRYVVHNNENVILTR
jgi:FkbM family methyltransferase